MDENMNGASEITMSSETEKPEAEAIKTETEVTPNTEEDGGDNTAAQTDTDTSGGGSVTEDAPFLTVKYNHEEKGLTQEEAVTLAQKGIKYETLESKLEYLAATKKTSIDKFLNGLISEYEEEFRQGIIDVFGDEDKNVPEEMLRIHRNRLGAEYQKEMERAAEAVRLEEKNAGDRLSEEFNEIRREFPELSNLDTLPKEVKNAVLGGKPLLDAYLCHKHRENMRIAAERNRAKAVSQKTVGSMTSEKNFTNKAEQQYLNALWNR